MPKLSWHGLPIAAYLGALVALALTAAFVAVISIVIWLPPRPPDVMRADIISDDFMAGYDYMRATGQLMPNDGMGVWEVRNNAPASIEVEHMRPTRAALAQRLNLTPDKVRISARVSRSDVFVFRVRDSEAMVHDAERAIAEAERHIHEETHREITIESGNVIDEDEASDSEAPDVRRFEFQIPTPPPTPTPTAPVAAPSEPGAVPPAAPAPPAPPTPMATPEPPMFAPAPPGVLLLSGFQIGAQLPDGRWLVMRQGRNWEELSWIGRAVLIIGGTLAVLSLLAVLFARRLTRPIRNFSNAVQAVGVDPQSEPVREEGPRELRGAARAVNTMQGRLRALIADRTKTLAAVAHDMRTPLMRLRLQAENAPPEQRDRMAKEIGEVEALVASFIAFARDDPAEEARVRLDLAALLQSIADDHGEHRRDVRFEGEERLVITGQSLGLKRLFGNLVDNALKYGATARMKLRREDGHVVIDVEDDGPGVPADQRETVFEPFVRLNEEGTRGAGLGLAAARSIARAHGGDIVILDAERGALLRVTLPA